MESSKIKKRGRKSLEFSEKEKEEIIAMAAHGLKDEDIALIKKTSEATLQRRANYELKFGRALGKSKVTQTGFAMAVSGKCPAMTMFFLKTRCGFRETDHLDLLKANEAKTKLLTISTSDPIEAAALYENFMKG